MVTIATAAVIAVCPAALAVTVLSGPTLTRAGNAPLAAVLQLTTDVDSRISVLATDGTNNWERGFYDFSTNHSIPLLGFKPGRTNQVSVTVHDKAGNAGTAAKPLTFITGNLPAAFPRPVVLKSDPNRMEPGYTLFMLQNKTTGDQFVTIVDNAGEVVWYSPWTLNNQNDGDVRQLANGDLFIEESEPLNRFLEVNLLGQIVKTWQAPAGHPVNFHEGVPTDHGTILYLSNVSRVVTNFPSNATDPKAPLKTVRVDDNPVVEISTTNSALLNIWSPLDVLDPRRVTYLTYGVYVFTSYGVDNEHANAVIEDPRDSSIIVSLRNQNAVFKIARSTGQLKWILGPPANWGTNFQRYLFTPVGTPFSWNYGQHAPDITPQGTLLLYNNGIERASPFDPPLADQDNHSGAIEYSLNETNMVVSQVWDSSQAGNDRLFTPIVGDADWLPLRGNVLVTYGNVTYVNGVHPSLAAPDATMARIIEYTHDPIPEVVFDLSFFDANNKRGDYLGCFCYRSDRISDLYPHPAVPVSDLVVSREQQGLLLKFSADPSHNYLIQASADLANWTSLGAPLQGEGIGEFDSMDLNVEKYTTRFYRVVTQ
jgi:arylsulfate sulfotransferase